MKKKTLQNSFFRKIWIFLAVIGPGLITASADNDAPGIATYSMAGSRFGYSFLWLLLLVTFGEVAVQEMAARMGAVTGKGTADLIREKFGVKVTFFAMICLLTANLGTTIAQFAGIAASAELFNISRFIAVPIAAVFIGFLVLGGSYRYVEKVFLFLCLSALSYVVSAFINKPDWGTVLQQTLVPSFYLDRDYILAVLATIGTTITPWGIFYIQATVVDKGVEAQEYGLTRADVVVGAVWGNIISAFIIITTATTLFAQGIVVEEAAQAAQALEPLAGSGAKYLFSIGLLGASLLASSVLPLSTVYAVTEAFGWERGLDNRREDAPIFYGLYVFILVVSAAVVLLPKIPLFRIMWLSQSINAILLPIILVLLLRLANNREMMGKFINSKVQNYFTVFLTIVISLITLLLFIFPLLPF